MTEKELHKLLVAKCRGAAFTRIENSISSGIFDTYASLGTHYHWVEHKIRDGNLIKVSGTQYIWGTEQLDAGAENLWFLVGSDRYELALFCARQVVGACDPNYNDGRRHMLVDVSVLSPAALGFTAIRKILFDSP